MVQYHQMVRPNMKYKTWPGMVPPKINLTKRVRPKRSPNDTTKHEISIFSKWYSQISTWPKNGTTKKSIWPRNGMTKYLLDQKMGRPKNQFDQEMVWPNIHLSKMERPNINVIKKRYGQISIYPKWYGQTSIWPRMIWPNKNFAQNGMTKYQFNQETI